jgi:hypothetical protein
MLDRTNPDVSRRKRLAEVIGALLVAVDAGHSPNPGEWLARQPELADFFADRERVDVLVGPLRAAPTDQTGRPTRGRLRTPPLLDSMSVEKRFRPTKRGVRRLIDQRPGERKALACLTWNSR